MNIDKLLNMSMNFLHNYIAIEDEKYFILIDEGIKNGMLRVYELSAQDDIVFDKGSDSIAYVRIQPGYEFTFRSGNEIPKSYITGMTPPVHVLKESFRNLPKGIRNRIDFNEYLYVNEINKNWDNIAVAISYLQGCDTDTTHNIFDAVNKILREADTETCKRLSRRVLLMDPYITMIICDSNLFRKFLFKHISEFIYLKRHCSNFPLSIWDILVANFAH